MDTAETAIRLVGALAIILGLLMVALYGLRHWGKGFQGRQSEVIHVMATRMILPRKHICLVRIGTKTLVLGASDHGLQLLDTMEEQEDGKGATEDVQG